MHTLIFALTDKNTRALENYTEVWDKIKNEIQLISCNEVTRYSKDVMKITFESDDDLPLSKIINNRVCVIVARGDLRKIINISHKFYYTNVFMNMKKMQILQLCEKGFYFFRIESHDL